MTRRCFEWLLGHRTVSLAAVLLITLGLGTSARRVHPDYSVEHLFPVWDSARQVYDRFKANFPYEDARAIVIVEAPDLFTREGLTRIGQLESALRAVPDVLEVVGPRSIKNIVPTPDGIAVEPLFPSADLPPLELARERHIATTDRLFAWNLAKPDGSAITIQVTLTTAAARSDHGRQLFLGRAEAVLHHFQRPGQRLVLSGIPAIRAQFARLIQDDVNRLLPLALLGVLLLLFIAYRSLGSVLASFLTMVAALVWSQGVMGLLGYPVTMLSSIMPIVIIIISLSDTVHIVSDFSARRRAGEGVRDALVTAMSETAIPCLLTEIVLACGFLSLVAVNIVAVYEFGIATAVAMLLTWFANMTVLPLSLALVGGRGAKVRSTAPWAVQRFEAAVDWIALQTTTHARRVVVVALCILAVAALLATRVRSVSYAFDDLRPGSPLARDLRFAEATHGGLVPVAIYIEASKSGTDSPILQPDVIRTIDRGAALLRSFPEIHQANSLADYLRKAHGYLAGTKAALGDGLPKSANLTAQEVTLLDDGSMLRNYLSRDRRAVAALGYATDAGSPRVAKMFKYIDAWVASAQSQLDARYGRGRFHVYATGQLKIFKDVNDQLLQGLAASFGGAILVSLIVFCIVLRSWRLGLIGLIPNVSPILLVLAFMALAGISLKPATVILFSITLTIADDDTIQYLARFRTHYHHVKARGSSDVHREAAIECLREVGLPMFITSTSVSLGFMLLLFSRFAGTAHVGLLIGATLFAAVFADLFLSPILLMKIRPNLK